MTDEEAATSNLETALRYLRHVSEPRLLWISAIYINQRDIPERNTQVMHIGDVYSGASRVLAWLGKEDEDSTGITDKTLHSTRSSLSPQYSAAIKVFSSDSSGTVCGPFKRSISLLFWIWFADGEEYLQVWWNHGRGTMGFRFCTRDRSRVKHDM